jgi:hypothetical protein
MRIRDHSEDQDVDGIIILTRFKKIGFGEGGLELD